MLSHRNEQYYILPTYLNCTNWNNDFNELQTFLSEIDLKNILVLGDLNARIGEFQNPASLMNNTSHAFDSLRRSSDVVVNSCGRRLKELVEDFGLMVLNGITNKDSRGELTFISGQGCSLIDYCLARGDWFTVIEDFEVQPASYSAHLPIVTSIKFQNFDSTLSEPVRQYKWIDSQVVVYKRRLDTQVNSLSSHVSWSCEQSAGEIIEVIKRSAMPSNGKQNFAAEWYDWECIRLRKKSFAMLKLFRKTKSNFFKSLYLDANKTYKRVCKIKEKMFMNGLAGSLSKCKDSKSFWSKVRLLGGVKKFSATTINVEIQANHFMELLNASTNSQVFQYALPSISVSDLDDPITITELQEALKNMKSNKAAGLDGIPAEFYKNSSPSFVNLLLFFFNKLLEKEEIPQSFLMSQICPIFKKGDPSSPANYRGISILPCLRKLFTQILYCRLIRWIEENQLLSTFQAGFRSGLSTVDQIFALYNIAKRFIDNKQKLYVFFIDFRAAFDTINRNSLLYKLSTLGISTKFLRLYKLFLTNTCAAVSNGSYMSSFFKTDSGVPQGCPLSPIMFALFIDDVSSDLPGGVRFGGLLIKVLLYADDLVVLSDNPTTLQLQINRLKSFCDKWDLNINTLKSKIMIFESTRRRRNPLEAWSLDREPIEVVNQFKYLGVLFCSNLDFRPHVKEKCLSAKTAINLIWNKIFCNKYIGISAKFRIFEATINSCLCYASQVFGYQDLDEFEIVQRFFFKRIFKLPNSTPTYAIHVESGIPPIFLRNLKFNADYIVKVMQRSNENLHKQMMDFAFRRNLSPFKEWNELANTYGFNLNLSTTALANWQGRFYECIAMVDDSLYLKFLNRAQTSPSRLVYKQLNHTLFINNYFNSKLSANQISTLFKARTEMLNLNYKPHRNDNPRCNLCNRNEIEDVSHFLAVCPILQELRRLYFLKSFLSHQEAKQILNGEWGWKDLYSFMDHALDYRNSFLE